MKRTLIPLVLLLALLTSTISAQSPDAQKLYTKLYCPLCGGVRLDVCELKVCADMKQVVQQKLAAGESDQKIIDYFRSQYGDQVLGYPPTEGINWLPWLIPFALVFIGGLALWKMAAGWTRGSQQANAEASAPIASDMAARIERELNE